MNIVIVGQGAIGLLWYAQLYNAKVYSADLPSKIQRHEDEGVAAQARDISQINQLSLLSSNSQYTKNKSLIFNTHDNLKHIFPIRHTKQNDVLQADLILVCVKSYQVASVLEKLPKLKDNSVVVLCHNGLGTLPAKTATVQETQAIISMLISHGSRRESDIEITHTGRGSVEVGLIQGEIKANLQEQLIATLNSAMLTVWQSDIQQKQWSKLAINCVINPLTAINDIDNGEVALPKFKSEVQGILEEFIVVAKHQQITFNLQSLTKTVIDVAKKTAINCSSMRSDVQNNRRTEIDFINGFIVAKAAEFGIETPFNRRLVEKIQMMTAGYEN